MADVESGTQEVSRNPLAGEIESACNQIDLALASALVCLNFLGENTTGVSHVAVSDAEAALQRVDAVVETLRRALAIARERAGTAGTGTTTG